MKKDFIYITIAVIVICIIGVVAYLGMSDLGYFDKTDNLAETGLSGAVLIPVMKYLWDKVVQLFYLVVTILIGGVILAGIGIIFS